MSLLLKLKELLSSKVKWALLGIFSLGSVYLKGRSDQKAKHKIKSTQKEIKEIKKAREQREYVKEKSDIEHDDLNERMRKNNWLRDGR